MSEKLTDDRLREIKERCEKATKGPWSVRFDKEGDATAIIFGGDLTGCDFDDEVFSEVCRLPVQKCGYGSAWASESNGDFISHARTDIPDLLAHAAALQAEIDRLNCKGVMPKGDGLRVIPNKFLPRGVIMANPDDLGLTEIEPTIGEEEI